MIIIPLLFLAINLNSIPAQCQTTMSIMPVSATGVYNTVLNVQQWNNVALQMQENLLLQLGSLGSVNKLSREHILLLLKEMPSPDPDNLNEEAYKIISKKEQLRYMLKCSVESIQVIDKNVLAPIRIIIIDGSNGKIFWEKLLKINKIVSNPVLSEHILLNEVFKPAINDVSKEIKALKY